MTNKLKYLFIATITLICCTSAYATTIYYVERSIKDEIFIINNEVFKAMTYCPRIHEGDQVIFISGSPYGACASAELYDINTSTRCRVWCE